MTPGVRYPLADGRSVVYFTAPLPHLRLFRKSTRVGSVWGLPARLQEWFNDHTPSAPLPKGKPMKGKLLSLLFGSALSFVAFAACAPDHVYASGFERTPPLQLVEFSIVWPLHIETVTCQSWAGSFNFIGGNFGNLDGSKCTATAAIPDRIGTSGDVSATFGMLSGGTVTLDGCAVQGFDNSGGGGSFVITTILDCT